MVDWKTEIVEAVLVQQRIEELDRAGLWPRYFPEVAATPAEIADAERRLDMVLDSQYRNFLFHANGWRCFWQMVDLFGTNELAGGRMMQTARRQLAAVEEDDFLAVVGLPIADVVPIAASSEQRDMFLMPRTGDAASSVIWYEGSVIERFPTFEEFFLAMVDYNRLEIDALEHVE